ncbi:LOW QUALITY PROTEIN: Pol protein [Phytophthora palmivora]|uniref:Pol protein n=1 Tax=Phytophthora palmivora TaxID=4796 RepID=A0A2P4X1V3_9STRA|nr:LOW QUALITY PROTEIN: Pol protein [Phytophthora palmivora]
MVSQTFWWPRMYKWGHTMSRHVKHRVKPSGHASAPLQSLPVPAGCWKSRNLNSVFGLPADDKVNTEGVWDALFQLLGTELTMSAADHPRTDGQTERVNRVLEDTLRSICAETPRSWSDELPMVEFELYNAVHTSTGFTPFYLNGLRHLQVPLTLREGTDASIVSGGEARKAFSSQVSEIEPKPLKRQLSSFIDNRPTLSAGRNGVDPEQTKEYSDKNGRGNLSVFMVGDLVLLNTKDLPLTWFAPLGLKHCFIVLVEALGRHGAAYTIDLAKSMATHPTSYVGRLKRIFALREQKKIKSGRAPLFKSRLSLADNTNRSCQSLQNGTLAGTHAAHKNSTLGPHGHLTMRLIGKSIKAPTESL